MTGKDSMRRLYGVARDQGLGPAVAALHRAVGERMLAYGPGGHALAPAELLRTATHAWHAGQLAPRTAEVELRGTQPPLDNFGLVPVNWWCPDGPPGHRAQDQGYLAWAAGVAWLRLGLSQRLLGTVLSWLGDRAFGGAPLLQQQMIKGELADSAVVQLELHSGLTAVSAAGATAGLSARVLTELHDRITLADRARLRLLGAVGFTTAGPGHIAWASELLADVYALPPAWEEAK